MSPVSSSSSFSRQQRAQPSHRLSHSALDISSNVLVFQKKPSWLDGFLGAAVIAAQSSGTAWSWSLLGGVIARPQVGGSIERFPDAACSSWRSKVAAGPLVYGPS